MIAVAALVRIVGEPCASAVVAAAAVVESAVVAAEVGNAEIEAVGRHVVVRLPVQRHEGCISMGWDGKQNRYGEEEQVEDVVAWA